MFWGFINLIYISILAKQKKSYKVKENNNNNNLSHKINFYSKFKLKKLHKFIIFIVNINIRILKRFI